MRTGSVLGDVVRELLGEARWSVESALALSPIGRWLSIDILPRYMARRPEYQTLFGLMVVTFLRRIQVMRKFNAALIVEFEPPRRWSRG